MFNNYTFHRSAKNADRFICTNTRYNIVCEFERGKYNETQKFTMLDGGTLDGLNVQDIATIMREFGDYLSLYHYNQAMPPVDGEYLLIRALKARRQELDMTQAELAEKCGYKRQTIQRIEGGKFAPNLKTLQTIAAALGVDLTII